MRKPKLTAVLISAALNLLLASCVPGAAATTTPEAVPTSNASALVVAEGRLEPVRFAQIALNASGLVSEVLRREGDPIKVGEVIARLENSQAKTLQTAQADALKELTVSYQAVRDAQYNLDNFVVPADFAGLTPNQAVQRTQEKLNVARDAFAPYKYIDERLLELTEAEKDHPVLWNTPKRLKKDLDDAWGKYRRAVQWLDRESALENAQAQLAQSQKDYDSLHDATFAEDTAGLRAALANAEVRAPFAGTITNLDLKVGEFSASGTPVVTVADLANWVVKTTDLTEIDVVNVKEGQPVTLTLDALPGVTFNGYVLSIANNFSERQGDIVYKVTVLLSDKNPGMRWGMTAQVNFGR